ncbi:LOW QUALITY PROTEIN: hypothetical protein ColTof4_14315 [Colletotrichum tofieldiae]|nr:LOW QUALITY PROTEIN: hypothetical protein ColTof4_14315 [Colletotrichum tofieldiae]
MSLYPRVPGTWLLRRPPLYDVPPRVSGVSSPLVLVHHIARVIFSWPSPLVFSNTPRPLALHEGTIDLQRLHLRLLSSLQDTKTWVPSEPGFYDLYTDVANTCQNISVLFGPSPTSRHHQDIHLTCALLTQRIGHILSLWRRLHPSHDAELHLRTLGYTARLLTLAAAELPHDRRAFARSFRLGVLDDAADGRAPWLSTCQLCQPPVCDSDSEEGEPGTADVPGDDITGLPPIASWHFACESDFRRLFTDLVHGSLALDLERNTDTNALPRRTSDQHEPFLAYLTAWAAVRSAKRHDALQSPYIDVDGVPLYPGNLQPSTEADDTAYSDLASEGEGVVFALTRQLVELAVGIDELVVLLTGQGHFSPATTIHDDMPLAEGVSESGSGWLGRMLTRPVWPKTSQHDGRQQEMMAIQSGVSRLISSRASLLAPVVASLGSVAAGMANACLLAAIMSSLLDDTDQGLGTLNSTTATVESLDGATTGTSLFDVHVSHTLYTPDPMAVALALHKELDVASEFVRTRFFKSDPTPPPRPALNFKHRDEPPTPKNNEFTQKVRQGVVNQPLQELASAFGVPSAQGQERPQTQQPR